jgi:hypothetical protein
MLYSKCHLNIISYIPVWIIIILCEVSYETRLKFCWCKKVTDFFAEEIVGA